MLLTRPLTRFLLLLTAVLAMTASAVHAAEDKPAANREQEFLAVLRSEAPDADKAIACKQLAIYGSDESVPDLAKLLSEEKFASWARIALEAIPGPVAVDVPAGSGGGSDHPRLEAGKKRGCVLGPWGERKAAVWGRAIPRQGHWRGGAGGVEESGQRAAAAAAVS